MFSNFLKVFEGPGGFNQTCRIDFRHSSYLADFMVPSYEEKLVLHLSLLILLLPLLSPSLFFCFAILVFSLSALVEGIGHF